ncbi:MAG: hypothetical protein ABIP31_11740 [Chitinophagaceae bacterium]
MEIKIEAGQIFRKVQEEFTKYFPYLRIEMVSKGYVSEDIFLTKYYGHSKEERHTKMADDNPFILLTDNTTVKDLRYQFKELFNVSVKVQRKSDGHWVETTLTEHWTLTKQNIEGKSLASFDFRQLKGD